MNRTVLSCLALSLLVAPRLRRSRPPAASVQVGSSGWLWGNPLPQGNTVNAHRRSPAPAATPSVTSGRSSPRPTAAPPGPASRPARSRTSASSRRSTATRCSPAAAASAGARTTAARRSGASRSRRSSPLHAGARRRRGSSSEAIGYLVLADGTVLRTDNNGETFSQRIAVTGHARRRAAAPRSLTLRFLDANIGFATTTDGKIYRTADGANSWTVVSDTQRGVRAMHVLRRDEGRRGRRRLAVPDDDRRRR